MRAMLFIVAVGVFAPALAQGAVLVQYTFPTAGGAGVETHASLSPTTTASGLSATAVADTSSKLTLGTETPTPNYASEPVLRVNPDGNATSTTTAVANGVYFSFAVTPDSGNALDLSSLTFNAGRGGGSTARGLVVRTSLDGYTTDLAAGDIVSQRPTWTPYNLDLSGATYQGVTGPITFRFYTYSPAAGSTIEFDDITVNGSVSAVPEPATWTTLAVLALVGGALAWRRRAN